MEKAMAIKAEDIITRENRDAELYDRVLEDGCEVAFQDWDSGGPGAGAGRVSVYLYEDRYYVIDEVPLSGPFGTKREALEYGQVDVETDATEEIWHADETSPSEREGMLDLLEEQFPSVAREELKQHLIEFGG